MQKKYNLIFIIPAIAIIVSQANIVQAQWSALVSGYAVTTNYHGKDVPPGTLVIATAGTTDASVKTVTFYWKYPNDTVAYVVADVSVAANGTTWDGKLIYYAQSSYTPITPTGDWGVQAVFKDSGHCQKGHHEDIVAIRATSYFVTPEVPFGTVTVLLILLGALSLFARRKV